MISRPPESPAAGRHAGRYDARLLAARLGSLLVGSALDASGALRRRRAVLGGLTGGLALTALAVLLGLPAGMLLLPGGASAGYVLWLRRTAVQAAASRQAAHAGRRAGFRDFGAPAVGADPALGATLEEPIAPARSETGGVGAGGRPYDVPSTAPWLPVPLPLPSYITAPPAPAVIDGDWHEELLLEGELPGEASAYALGEEVLRRRAVGD